MKTTAGVASRIGASNTFYMVFKAHVLKVFVGMLLHSHADKKSPMKEEKYNKRGIHTVIFVHHITP